MFNQCIKKVIHLILPADAMKMTLMIIGPEIFKVRI